MNETLCPQRNRARVVSPRWGASRWSGKYWLPAIIGGFLDKELGTHESAPKIVARFLCRFHGGPRNLGRSFHILRNSTKLQERLGLTAKQIRGAIAKLKEIGFLKPVERPEGNYRWSRIWGKAIRHAADYAFTGMVTKWLRYMFRKRKPQGPVRCSAPLGEKIPLDSPNGAPEKESYKNPSVHLTGPRAREVPQRPVSEADKAEIDRALTAPTDAFSKALARFLGIGTGRKAADPAPDDRQASGEIVDGLSYAVPLGRLPCR